MPTLAELQEQSDARNLVRKVRRAVGLLAPLTVDLPEALTGPNSLPIDLKALGFLPIGIVTPDGYNFARDVEKDDVDAFGYASYIRSDITRVARSVTFTAMEQGRRHLNELLYGTDLSAVSQAANGEIVFDEPDLPVDAEWRFLVVGDDGPLSDNWILGKGMPRVKVANVGGQQWSKEGAVTQEVTLDIFTDDEIGTPVRHYLGGTGAVKHADVLGYTQAP